MSAWRWWDFKPEAIELMHEGVYDAEISRRLGVPTYYLRSWRKEAGLPPSKGRPIDKPLYTTEQLNAVIELIHEGNTISEIIKILEAEEVASYRIATLCYKPEAYKKSHRIDYIGLEIPNKFIVGYGLDYDGLGRNLPEIYQLK